MRSLILAATAAAALSTTVVAPAQAAMGIDPDASIRVQPGVTFTGETVVRVNLDNTASTTKVTGEIVRENTMTGRFTSQYITVGAHKSITKRFEQTVGNTFKYSVNYFDATAASKTVRSHTPTKPYARIGGVERGGAGTLVTFEYGNYGTKTAKTFVTSVILGDGTNSEMVKRTKVLPGSVLTATFQIGCGPAADTDTHLADGSDLGSRFVEPLC